MQQFLRHILNSFAKSTQINLAPDITAVEVLDPEYHQLNH